MIENPVTVRMNRSLRISILLKYILLPVCLLAWLTRAMGQPYFPVKKQHKWGLIDAEGKVVLPATYEAMSNFDRYGYATVQNHGLVGIISNAGKTIMPVAFSDIKILDSLHFAVQQDQGWMLLDARQQVLTTAYYQDIRYFDDRYYEIEKADKWGLMNSDGAVILPPDFEKISRLGENYLVVEQQGNRGVVSLGGETIVNMAYDEILLLQDVLFLVKRNSQWGVVGSHGTALTEVKYTSFDFLADHYLRLYTYGEKHLFSLVCQQIIAQERISRFLPISEQYVMIRQREKVGVVDYCGQPVLIEDYDEILWFADGVFRVKRYDRWALVGTGDQALTSFQYDYISPATTSGLAKARVGGKVGLVNKRGQLVIAVLYDKIDLNGQIAKGFTPQGVDLFKFDEEGQLLGDVNLNQHFQVRIGSHTPAPKESQDQSSYILDQFEWFYHSEKGRWGLRDHSTGQLKVSPSFEEVSVYEDLGLSIVGLPSSRDFEWERTTIRLNKIYGIVNNREGYLIGDMQYRHVFMEDFKGGHALARCILEDGSYAFIDREGHCTDDRYTYIGPFREGFARALVGGQLNARLKSHFSIGPLYDYLLNLRTSFTLIDNTKYDELLLNQGEIYAEGGFWTYLDDKGQRVTDETFDFVIDMVNEVGMVYKSGKWGLLGAQGRLVIPCAYDDLAFLENTGNQIVKLYVRKTRYGLIDTLGKLTISAIYDEVGKIREARLSVMKDGLWGFTDHLGQLTIPCTYEQVRGFNEGMAAVRKGARWGYINRRGELLIPYQYKTCGDFSQGMAWVETDRGYGYIDTTGQMQIQPEFEEARTFFGATAIVKQGSLFGLINLDGAFIERPKYLGISDFDEYGLAVVRHNRSGDRYAVINAHAIQLTSHTYREIEPFSDGLARVKAADKYGYINLSGEEVIPPRYWKAGPFREGRAAVYESAHCGYIDREGRKVTDFAFSRCQPFEDERAVVYRGMHRAGLVNIDGELILEPSVNQLITFSEGRGLVRDQEYRFYYITEEADRYRGFYEKATEFQNGVAVIRMNNKWGIINRKGITLVRPKYSRIEDFENGYAKVELEGVSGLSDIKGDMIVQPGFEYISYAGQGLFRVEQGDQIGYFDQQGDWVWALQN